MLAAPLLLRQPIPKLNLERKFYLVRSKSRDDTVHLLYYHGRYDGASPVSTRAECGYAVPTKQMVASVLRQGDIIESVYFCKRCFFSRPTLLSLAEQLLTDDAN